MRSPLAIWRALEQARRLHLDEAGEAPPIPGGDGLSRRRLLRVMGAAGAGLMLPPVEALAKAARPDKVVPDKVVVVGGGLAGLTALDRLRAAGVEAVLYEARGAVGGRTRSVRGVFAPGYAFDEGGQLVNSDHRDMIRLVRRLGLRLVDRRQQRRGREIHVGRSGAIVAERDLAEDLRGIAAQIGVDADRLDANHASVAPEIDRLSVAAYLDRHGLKEGDARDALEAGIRSEYGVEPEQASALELIFNLPTVEGQRFTRLSLSDERYLVEGGAGRVAQRLGEQLAPAIKLRKRLRSVVWQPRGVLLRFDDGEEVWTDRTILALPAPILREIRFEGLLPELWRTFIDEVNVGLNEKLIVGYDEEPWRKVIGFDGAVWSGTGFSLAWDAASTNPGPAAGAPGALCYFLGGAQIPDSLGDDASTLAARFSTQAGVAIPALPPPNGRLRRTRWSEDPFARGAYVAFRPGQLTRFGSLLTVETPRQRRVSGVGPLIFAGEWLSDAWPAYMNGAVQTGRLAAEAALGSSVRRAAPGRTS